MSAKRIILNSLADDDLKKVFQGLFSLADQYKNEELRDNATFQSGRLKGLEKQRRNGTISREEDNLQTAKIRKALLEIVQGLPDDWTLDGIDSPPAFHPGASKINWKRYAAAFGTAIALSAGIAELSGYSIKDIFETKETTEQPVQPPPRPDVRTSGNNSPAIITDDGDVKINYGETKPKKDTIIPTQNPQK